MNIKQFLVGLAAVLILGIVALFFVAPVLSQGPALPPGDYDLEAGQYVFNVPEVVPPIDTPIPPTDTPVPPTDTPVPVHDDRAWHPLSADISHEHKDNPHDVDDIFGTEFYALAGGDISYPWETPSENLNKHEGYGWITYRGPDPGEPCEFDTRFGLCVTAFRYQFHAIFSAHGAVTRFHSYALEARVCDPDNPNVCGIVRMGGWFDFGALHVNSVHVPLDSDDDYPGAYGAAHRAHHYPTVGRVLWQGRSPTSLSGVRFNTYLQVGVGEVWGPVDPANPSELLFVCPLYDCDNNSSIVWAQNFLINLSNVPDPDEDGIVSLDIWVNRYNEPVEGCTEVSLDCIPLKVESVPVGQASTAQGQRVFSAEADISPEGEWWIRYPN